MVKITGTNKPRSVIGTIRTIIGREKPPSTRKRAPDAYYRQIYLSKENYNGVEFLAKATKTSRVRMANELIRRGLRSFYGEVLGEEIRDNIEKRAHRDDLSLFLYRLKKYARSQGYDISAFIK